MTTLRTLVPGEVGRELAEIAAAAGLTVNELHTKATRDRLAAQTRRRRITSTQWADAERGLDWLTRQRTGVRESCKACGAAVLWVESVKNDRPMPVDPLPHPDGNLRLERRGNGLLAHVLPKRAPRPERTYRPHFATCPHAGQLRRRGHLRLVADRPTKAGPDGRRYPDSTVLCPDSDGYVAQALVDVGIRRHLTCGDPLTDDELDALARVTPSTGDPS
jgi:hypothetical protein